MFREFSSIWEIQDKGCGKLWWGFQGKKSRLFAEPLTDLYKYDPPR